MTSTHFVNNCAQNFFELITPVLKDKLQRPIARELPLVDTQANSPSTASFAQSAAPESLPAASTINTQIDEAMREHLRAIGKLFIDQNLNPSDSIASVLLQSKLRQYKSL